MELDGANILKDLNQLEERDPTFAFKIQSTPDEEVVKLLWDKYSIALRTENYCSRAPEVYDVLLAMLKTEKDSAFQIGRVMAKNAETYGAPGLGTMDLMRFLRGKLAFDAKGKYRHPGWF